MVKSDRGQLSAEFIIIAGFIIVTALVVASFVGENNEVNNVLASAKIASVEASNDIAYDTGNVIRFNNMTFDDGDIRVTVYSKKNLSSDDIEYMENKIMDTINVTLGDAPGRYNYQVTVVNTS